MCRANLSFLAKFTVWQFELSLSLIAANIGQYNSVYLKLSLSHLIFYSKFKTGLPTCSSKFELKVPTCSRRLQLAPRKLPIKIQRLHDNIAKWRANEQQVSL